MMKFIAGIIVGAVGTIALIEAAVRHQTVREDVEVMTLPAEDEAIAHLQQQMDRRTRPSYRHNHG